VRRMIALLAVAALAAALLALGACKSGGDDSGCGKVSAAAKGDEANGPPVVDGDIVTTGSCLRYIDLEVGSGESPHAGDTIAVHYTGYLEDGTRFASSLDSGAPLVFVLGTGDVIRGWDEGLATIQTGGKRRLIIPPELAYGAEGRPPTIPANATLIFDVELVEIQ
jgi:FKBP-type peptidyl-prolyl cis-trans isomerase